MGDPQQLPATVLSRQAQLANMERSMFERYRIVCCLPDSHQDNIDCCVCNPSHELECSVCSHQVLPGCWLSLIQLLNSRLCTALCQCKRHSATQPTKSADCPPSFCRLDSVLVPKPAGSLPSAAATSARQDTSPAGLCCHYNYTTSAMACPCGCRFQKAGCPVTMLSVQYRMHPCIRQFPSQHFYNNQLQDG